MYETFPGSPASKGELQFNMWGLTDDETPSNRQKDEGLMKNIQKYSVDVANDQGYNWDALRERIKASGMRNSLLVAPMPTASTSQILGVNSFQIYICDGLKLERYESNCTFITNFHQSPFLTMKSLSLQFIMANPHLLQDLTDRGLWTASVRNQLMRDSGSVANIDSIPDRLKNYTRQCGR